MISRLPARFASVVLMLFLGHSQIPASAQELSARELKKVVKQAEKSFGAGRFDEAIKLYDQILASTSGTDAGRGDALYASAVIRLSDDGHQDVEAARRQLDELQAFPRHPRRLEIAALRHLFSGLDSAQADVERRTVELAAKSASYQAEREQAAAAREEAAGESEAAGGRVRSLEAQLRKVRAELSECQAELEKNEQAVQKLRDALVGGSG